MTGRRAGTSAGVRKAGQRARARQRLRGSRRGVLEGLPLSILISIFVIAIGAAVVIGLFEYARGNTLGSVSFQTPASYPGYLTASPTQLQVTAWAEAGGVLSGVTVVLNGSGVSERSLTTGNGSVFFWIDPAFREHATSGVISVTAIYAPGVSLVAQPTQTYSTTIPVLS